MVIVIFSFFAVPAAYQHRVLFWGILGALVMRAMFILAGAALLQRFHWIIYVFGGFLVVTGVKLLLDRGAEVHPERNPVYLLFRRFVPSVGHYYLRVGLAPVLCFVGVKRLIADAYKIPIMVSLAAVAALLAGSVAVSLLRSETGLPDPASAGVRE